MDGSFSSPLASQRKRLAANSQTVLGLMPLGSIMNVARTLWVPRDPALAARTIVDGKILAMDMGRVGDRYFLEAAGVGLDAGFVFPKGPESFESKAQQSVERDFSGTRRYSF